MLARSYAQDIPRRCLVQKLKITTDHISISSSGPYEAGEQYHYLFVVAVVFVW